MSDGERTTLVFAQREFQTLLRTRTVGLLAAGYAVVVLGFVAVSGAGGFLPLTLDLLHPLEVLVPLLAFAFGYRAIFDDAMRGELETIRTYSVSRFRFVAGVFLGRLAGFLPVVLLPMVLAGGLVVVGGSDTISVVAAHGTVDTPVIYLRFVTVTALFGVVALAIATAVSAVARSTREALALVVVLFIALVVGFDASIVAALSGGVISPGQLGPILAFSPNSAYRGLVLSVAVGEAYTRGAPTAAPLVSLLGLVSWFALSVVVAVRTVWRSS